MDRAVEVYEEASHVATLSEATVCPTPGSESTLTLVSTWLQRSVARGEPARFQRVYSIDKATLRATLVCPATDVSSEKYTATSPTGKWRATLRKLCNKTGDELQYLEIWSQQGLQKVIDLKDLNAHGSVYVDDDFASISWSPDETKLLYVAEKKKPKAVPFFKLTKSTDSPDEGDPVKGREFDFYDDWGEQMVGKHEPVIVILEVSSGSVSILNHIPNEVSPGLCVWTPDGNGVVGVAYITQPRRLGIIYCSNREGKIFHATLDGSYEMLNGSGLCIRTPKFSPDGKTLAWLERKSGGPHHACHRLMKCDWETKQITTVVDIVKRSIDITNDQKFYGIFSVGLLTHCWASDSRRLLLNTVQMNDMSAFIIDTLTGNICKIKSAASCAVLDVYEDLVAVAESSPVSPSRLLVGRLPGIEKEEAIVLLSASDLNHILDGTYWESMILKVPVDHPLPEYCELEYGALYMGPKEVDGEKVPLVVCPHGGPHSASTSQFNMIASIFIKLGFGVLQVNYRGSAGAGEDGINSLLGFVGNVDIKDVHHATLVALDKFPALDPEKVVLFGGSHGGFIVCHLSAQYPDFCKAVATRNPVTNISSMAGATDIPDWCWAETGMTYSAGALADADALKKMWEMSPLSIVHNVKAPTLLLTGKLDLRVPPNQSLQYYYALRANHVPVRQLVYEDNHPLSKVPVEVDSLINSILWFFEHLKIS